MAQQVLVYRLTGSAAALGIISFIGLLPVIPLSLWGGSITDRFPKRNVILFTNAGMMIQALLLALLSWTGKVQIWHLYMLSFLLAAFNAVDIPARQAFTVDMVEGKEDLANAIGLNSAMFNGARAIGPAMAGIVVAVTGEGWAFLINGLSFIAVIACLLLMRGLPGPSSPAQKHVSMTEHLKEGFFYVGSNKTVLVLFSMIGISAFLSMPYSTLMPVYAETILKDSSAVVINFICGGSHPWMTCQSPEALPLGILLTMIGLGALAGALYVAALPVRVNHGKLLTLANLCFPLTLLVVALSKSFLLSSLILFLVGVSFVVQNALVNTMLQLSLRDDLRGRVMSLYSLIFQSMMRLGGLQAGYVADWLGASFSVAFGAIISLFYGVFLAFSFKLHKANIDYK